MYGFDAERMYRPKDPALRQIASEGVLSNGGIIEHPSRRHISKSECEFFTRART